jgi:hypothetical protein
MLKKPAGREVVNGELRQENGGQFSVPRSSFRVRLFAHGCRGGFGAVGCWCGLDLAFGHDGGGATRFAVFVDLAIHNFHALEIFLDNFFPGELDVLFRLSASSLANPVDHVFLDHHTDLFREIGPG